MLLFFASLPGGAKGHRCALTAPLWVSWDLSDPADDLKASQRAAVSPRISPEHPSSATTTRASRALRLHGYQRAHSHPREEHGDLFDLCAVRRLSSIRLGPPKGAWLFTFPQAAPKAVPPRPDVRSCVLKTTPRPSHRLPPPPSADVLNEQPTFRSKRFPSRPQIPEHDTHGTQRKYFMNMLLCAAVSGCSKNSLWVHVMFWKIAQSENPFLIHGTFHIFKL